MQTQWVIEARKTDGTLDLSGRQPEVVFGMKAITGITDDEMAKKIYYFIPYDIALRGDQIAQWPSLIDDRWVARRKTW